MNTTENKIDITPLVYVAVMIVVFLLGSCRVTRPVIPAAKYTKSTCCKIDTSSRIDTWNGLSLEKYDSGGGFNYLEEAIKVFPDNK